MICRKCLLSDSFDSVKINSRGWCNFCRDFSKSEDIPRRLREENIDESIQNLDQFFEQKLRENRARGKYDVLVMVSGGKDSLAVLYNIVKVHKLRPLIYTEDNGFLPEKDKANTMKVLMSLGLDTKSWVYNRVFQRGKKIFQPYFKNPELVKNVLPCIWCSFFKRSLIKGAHQVARKYNINLIVTGQEYRDLFFLKNYYKKQFILASKYISKVPQSLSFFGFDEKCHQGLRRKYPEITSLAYWRNVYYNVEEWIKFMENEIGCEATWFTTSPEAVCQAVLARRLMIEANKLSKKQTKREPNPAWFINAQLVRWGQVSREYALKKMKKIEVRMTLEERKAFLDLFMNKLVT